MMTIYLVCFLDHRSAILVREKYYEREAAEMFVKDNPGHFIIEASES